MGRFVSGAGRVFLALFMLASLIILVLLFSDDDDRLNRLDLYNSTIASDRFAIGWRSSEGSSMFYGPTDGKASLEIRSSHYLRDPFIVDQSRLLLVEFSRYPDPVWRLLDLEITGSTVGCRQLMASNKYIGTPVAVTGKYVGGILFFTGLFMPESGGNTVPSRQLAMYRDGQITHFSGPTFATIGTLAQLSDNRFLGVSYSMYPNERAINYVFKANSDLFEIQIMNESILARPAEIGALGLEEVTMVASLPEMGTVAVLSGDYGSDHVGRQSRLTYFQNSGIEGSTFELLERGYAFHGPFLSIGANRKLLTTVFAEKRVLDGRDGSVAIMDDAEGLFGNRRKVILESATLFETSNCILD